jgi:hypothetical protein
MPPPGKNSLCIIPTMLSRNASCPLSDDSGRTPHYRSCATVKSGRWDLNPRPQPAFYDAVSPAEDKEAKALEATLERREKT